MPATTTTFVPTPRELALLEQLGAGEPVPFPENIKKNLSERLYEHGFVTVGINGGMALTERGGRVLEQARTSPH